MRTSKIAIFSALLCSVAALAQPSDVTGWHNVPWSAKKPQVLKVLQPWRVHEEPDGLAVDSYRLNGIAYHVTLTFSLTGLKSAIMTAKDEKGAFARVLAQLTTLYGKPGLESEYDGDHETVETRWEWVKPHGNVILESDETTLTITYAIPSATR